MAIIAISGKIGSGKDTVAEIIQLLIWSKGELSVTDIPLYRNSGQYARNVEVKSGFKVVRFADALKDMVCILLNCTREQLEDREFKEKELGEEWWYWKVYSNILEDKFELISYNGEKGFHDRKSNYKGHSLQKLTPRNVLQIMGTEIGRNITPNIWVNTLMNKYKPLNPKKKQSDLRILDYSKCDFPKWIIPDLRFPNELEAINKRQGVTIRVERPIFRGGRSDLSYGMELALHAKAREEKTGIYHPSETALDDAKFKYTIDNNGTIEDLIVRVKDILTLEEII